MQHILVPILTEEDVKASARVAEFIKTCNPLAVVVMNNPSLGIAPKDITAKIDKDLSDLESSKAQAVSREDFEGASTFKRQIEDKKMERLDVLRNGWKSVPEAARFAAYDELLKPFLAPWHVRNTVLPDDTDHESLLRVLANQKLPDCLPPGRFSIVTPRSIGVNQATPQPVQAVQTPKRVETAPKPQKAAVEPVTRESRKTELLRWYMKMKNAAQTHGIEISGVPKEQVVDAILAREFPEPATV